MRLNGGNIVQQAKEPEGVAAKEHSYAVPSLMLGLSTVIVAGAAFLRLAKRSDNVEPVSGKPVFFPTWLSAWGNCSHWRGGRGGGKPTGTAFGALIGILSVVLFSFKKSFI